ncbi:MAG: MMPL family transporter [Pirellulaceae bacterium]|nr:MMPL family transporter [Pirellulaceae bacterium]
MNKTFYARWAVPILCAVFFLVPFALRGARLAVERLENNVKDWLPPDFEETSELAWFGKNFMGEHFIVLTWESCRSDDPSFQLLREKLLAEIKRPRAEAELGDLTSVPESERPAYERRRAELQAHQLGDRLGLFTTGDYRENWGGQGEKWLLDRNDQWHYITPDGSLYRWRGKSNLLGAAVLGFRQLIGDRELRGELIAQLGQPPTATDKNDFHDDPRKLNARLFNSLSSGPVVLEELSREGGPLWPLGGDMSDEERAEFARRQALERLTGTLFGPDGEQTCIVVTLTKEATRDLRRVCGRGVLGKPQGRLIQLASEAGVTPPPSPPLTPFTPEPRLPNVLRLGGPPVDNVAIDEEGQITLVRLIGFSVFLGIALAYLSFRSVKITIMVFFVGGISAVASLSMVWWTGGTVDAILMSMPSLVYVLGLSGAVHIINYYRDAVQERGLEGAPERALHHGWGPCALAAFTTALGLISLCQSNIVPIRKFGFYSALGVMATLIVLFTYLPSALQVWKPPAPRRRNPDDQASRPSFSQLVARFWESFGAWIIRRHAWVTAGCVAIMLFFAAGLWTPWHWKIRTDVQLLKLFDSSAKIIRDYTWLEANIGKLVPMELVAEVDEGLQRPAAAEQDVTQLKDQEVQRQQLQYSFLERMELAATIQRAVERVLGDEGQGVVGRGISAASFAPELPPPNSYRTRLILNSKLEENRERILDEDYVAVDPQTQNELWRISLRVGALNNVDYGRFVGTLRMVVEPVLSAYSCRDQVLEQLLQAKGADSLRAARVCVLGLPAPKQPEEAGPDDASLADAGKQQPDASGQILTATAGPGSSAVPAAAGSPAAETRMADQVDQSELFSRTLSDLFTGRGFRGGASSKKLLYWHDPAQSEPPEGTTYQQALEEMLTHFDCVVLAADSPKYDADWIRQQTARQGTVLIDARQHTFQTGQPTAKQRGEPVRVTYTGVVPIVYKAQRTLLTSLIESIGWAFVMIAVVMMFVLRSGPWTPGNLINFRGGLISMLPNVFPVIVIFGFMGHGNILVDIGTMMTASVAMGVAVDDTIHYLTWFRNGLARGMTRHDSILEAYRRVGPAMTQTTLIGGLGLSIFAFSTFTPTQRFGTMMLTLLVAALFGDLVFLPAMLAGPLGRYFQPKQPAGGKPALDMGPGELGGAGELGAGNAATQTPHGTAAQPAGVTQQTAHSPLRSSRTSRLRSDRGH